MGEIMKNQQPSRSHWWWLVNLSKVKRSPWLQSTLTELNEKTKGMLKLIEEDADSFAQRAEMFYKKRPELLSMVEDFYRTHRLLAESYDQVRPETGIRQLKTGEAPYASFKNHQSEKLISFEDNGYDSYSENCDAEESVESEIDDPEHNKDDKENTEFVDIEVRLVPENGEMLKLRKGFEGLGEENKAHEDQMKQKDDTGDEVMMLREEIERLRKEKKAQGDELKQKDTVCDEIMMLKEEIERVRKENKAQKDELKQKDTICNEVMMLKEEIERVREENKAHKDDLKQKDKEKIEVIKQLSVTVDLLKQENVKMRKFIAKKWKNPFEFNKLIGTLSGKFLNGIPKNQPSIVAL